jgi:transcription elongation factor GreA
MVLVVFRSRRTCPPLWLFRPAAHNLAGFVVDCTVCRQVCSPGEMLKKEYRFMSDDRIPMTKEGYDKKKAELDHMKNIQMIEVAKRIATAREMGDLSENAEYHAAREDQGMLQARIDELERKLSNAMIVDKSSLPTDAVVFGAQVKVKDLDMGDFEEFQLVGPGEEDYNTNKILTNSPIGQGLLGKKIGDVAHIQVPMGTIRYEVVKISFQD